MTDTAMERYKQWLADPAIDEATKQELKGIEGQDKEIEDRFYKDLGFGTGGLRGVIGAGSNRMNRYTVGKATEGLARYLHKKAPAGGASLSAAIAYDSRRMSPEFALEAALVLASRGVKAYVFESLRPTPELSFAVRHLGASAGIVVTASHNPPEYNGYKVYGSDGGQLVPDAASELTAEIEAIKRFSEIQPMDRADAEAQGLLVWLGEALDEAYTQAVLQASPDREAARQAAGGIKIVYTPLHGAGNKPVRRALQQAGFEHVQVVPEQEQPDSEFTTVKSPNPEEPQAFTLAEKLAEDSGADLILATDPDSDRMGAMALDRNGAYRILTGNQSGALLVEYLLSTLKAQGKLPANGVVIKTIVTSELGAEVARSYGVEVLNTLTGFKYIGEKMTQFERTGEHSFLFGYEESYGYLAGTHARDKDAVVACLLMGEAAACYKARGLTLPDVLEGLYAKFGWYSESLKSITLKGADGSRQMQQMMDELRNHPPSEVAGRKVVETLDYEQGLNGLPRENALKFRLDDGSWFCLRPSGTEPKIKIYFAVRGSSASDAASRLEALERDVLKRVEP